MTTSIRYRQFLAVAEHGSYRRAAAALRISQPALTKSIQALEAELGVRLFDRQPRSVQLTDFGQRVLEYARQMVAAEQDLLHDLGHIAELSMGRIDVALGPYPSMISGYAAAARLVGRHPDLGITLHVANWRVVTSAIATRRADLGIAELTEAGGNPALQTELVGRHRAHLFCRVGHPLLRRPAAGLTDLLQYPWATTRIPPRIARALPVETGRAGRLDEATGDFVPAVELDVPMQLAAFAGTGETLVLSLFTFLERELADGRLAVVPTTAPPFVGEYGFIWLKQRSLSPAALAFMQAVRDEEQAFAQHEVQLAARYGSSEAAAPARKTGSRSLRY